MKDREDIVETRIPLTIMHQEQDGQAVSAFQAPDNPFVGCSSFPVRMKDGAWWTTSNNISWDDLSKSNRLHNMGMLFPAREKLSHDRHPARFREQVQRRYHQSLFR